MLTPRTPRTPTETDSFSPRDTPHPHSTRLSPRRDFSTRLYDYASQFKDAKIITVGDNVNDVPMLKEFGGYAVSNARDEAKAAAKHECNRICDMIEEIMKGN